MSCTAKGLKITFGKTQSNLRTNELLHVELKMSANVTSNDDLNTIQPTLGLDTVLLILLAAVVGAFAAVVVLPAWLPGLSDSLLSAQPKAYWYLARTAGVVAYVLLWASVALGVAIKNKMAQVWPGGPRAVDLHQFASLFALTVAVFHALILLGDRYANYSIAQILIPFAIPGRLSPWFGVGQLAFYVMLPVAFSFYARRFIGFKVWRLIHYASFVVYLFVTVHSLWSGTDATTPAMLGLYALTILATYFLTVYRILVSVRQPRRRLERNDMI
jgi:predicted ferric reductase